MLNAVVAPKVMAQETTPLLAGPKVFSKQRVAPLLPPITTRFVSSDEDDIDTSGTSLRGRGGSDAMTYDTMMQLSVPRNPFFHAKFRSFVICFMTSWILFLTNQLTTLPVGFFPSYAQIHFAMTPTELSVFFAVYPLCIMVSSPLAAAISPSIGRQTIICIGLVLSGTTTIAFAYTSTVSTVFVLRVLQGLGAGAAVVGAFSMITEEFSASIGQILVIQEFVVAAAFVTAPPIGSLLFEYDGYQTPFLVSGVTQIIVVMLVPFVFIEYSLPDGLYSRGPLRSASLYLPMPKGDQVGFRDVLTPTCVICLLLTVFSMASFGFIDPYLGTHLETVLGAQHFAIGLGFAVSAFVYFLGGLAYMWLSRNCGCKQVILLGLVQLSVGFFFLGPPPFLDTLFHDYNRLWSMQWMSLVFIGCGAALAIAPGLPLTLISVATMGPQAFNLVIGLFSAAVYLGQALGPFIALLFMTVLPSSHSLNCFAAKENAFHACESSLPWAFTTYSFIAMTLFVFVAVNLSTGEKIVEILQNNKTRFSLARQASEYGQFVFFDEDDFAENEVDDDDGAIRV
uniref:Major facilitator superfamily (MFS) profile domain-containing protein n=1 Tax=Globisporangium ultimum (strain ATCC 200006 / CBS 805.95 / DAOM BR144) TaxID=431595 RepID=K3WV79_GLOUD